MISGVDFEGLEVEEAIAYVAGAQVPEVVDGPGLRINGMWCDPDGDVLVPDPEN
jgi:hypothetical protein